MPWWLSGTHQSAYLNPVKAAVFISWPLLVRPYWLPPTEYLLARRDQSRRSHLFAPPSRVNVDSFAVPLPFCIAAWVSLRRLVASALADFFSLVQVFAVVLVEALVSAPSYQ